MDLHLDSDRRPFVVSEFDRHVLRPRLNNILPQPIG
jgi:hypothetical protein